MKRERWMRMIRFAAMAGLAMAWLGIVFRGRDGSVAGGIIYYATPWLLRLGAGLFAAIVVRHWGLRLMAVTCLAVSAMEGWHSFRVDTAPPVPEAALQAAIYNTGRTLETTPACWPLLAETDITAIVESGEFTPEAWERFTAATAGMEWRSIGGTMLGVRGKILSYEPLGEKFLFRCYRARVSLPRHGEFPVLVVDIRSEPWLSRERAMSRILRETGADPGVIVLGDFNTPPESNWLRGWQPALSLANNSPRRGFRETWAYGAPVHTLDQIWIGQAWSAIWTDHSRHGSDHSRVRTVLLPRASP